MPWTKEEAAEYQRAYYLANKEKRAEYDRAYTLENHESKTIASWRRQGHYIPEGTEHAAYTRFRDTIQCEFCGWELVEGGTKKTNTKARHHDHSIEGSDNFIAVICHVCNTRERCDNTSGEPNIYYHKVNEKWGFMINYCRKKYSKSTFKTFEEALSYKAAWFALNSPNVFHDPSWICELP